MTTDNEKGPLNQMESGQEKRSASEARVLSEIVNGTPSEILCQRGSPAPEQASETAAQQPAQADARVGLTDEQREAIQRAIDYADMSDRDSDAEALRALLTTPLPVPRAEVTDAARDVLAERRRQVEAEGWTAKHDDAHTGSEMALAAASYAMSAAGFSCGNIWPWDWHWYKPTTPRRDLVKAGALILAEVEKIDRAAARAGEAS
ncbi:hypothetical protein [Burkholderia vietnamiensis]|uniref:hypothetical protein n=1 Tax=Burkholderia vietnamiensis TaxID=60552 RepID=UPI000841594E|nr:hypothetical protein [Burkholderia vietnamiensis]AOJ99892.1 hypothetical protein WK23_15340 [Burkholderia vietnamiensis]